MTNRNLLLNKILKKIWVAAAILIIVAAVSSSIFRSLTPWAKQYKGEVEHHLTVLLGQPVTIQSMETGWYWFQPVLKLQHITVRNGGSKSLHLEKLLVGINLFKSLWHWRIQPGVLYVDDIDLVFRQKEGQWKLDGIANNTMNENQLTPEKSQELISWLSQQERLILRNISAHFYLGDGSLIPVSDLNLSVINHGGYYKLKGDAKLAQTNSSAFQLLGHVAFDPSEMNETQGQLFFSAKNIAPAQWQGLFPEIKERLEGGKGDISLWVDLNKGTVSLVQSRLKLKRLAWRLQDQKQSELIQSFYSNMSWKPNINGWEFQADHIKLRKGNTSWPENQVLVRFDKKQNSYQFFVKTLMIESLLSNAIDWPSSIESILKMQPEGVLSDTQIQIRDQQLNYFLTRFNHISWKGADNIPGITNLSGVLNWQPQEGRLELDSEHTTIQAKGYPKQDLELLNGAIDWKELSNGLRVSIERFVLSKPDLTISAQGTLDNVTKDSLGMVHLNADFSGKNLQQWMSWLPKKRMKPKLYSWLNNNVKRLTQGTGQLKLNGEAKDFPFDNNNGEFSIVSHIVGGDLLITPKWQLIKDLEGYIRIANRNLDIDIVNGDIQGVPVKQMNIRIDDLGKDRETMLIHSLVQGQAQKMMNFVMASPLSKKLKTLKMLSMKGLLLLNLKLEIPLYPENDDNLAQGDITFKNNNIVVKHQIGSLNVEKVTGELSFDEKGILQSSLVARAFGYPLNIKIQSVKEPKPYTTILLDGECTVESLKSKFDIPVLSVLKGMFNVNALFKLTDDPTDMDSVTLKTSLKGLAIDLPAPMGKTYDTKVPLEVTMDFNPQKAIRLRSNFNNRLSTDIFFVENKGAFDLQSGQIRLGSAHAANQNKPGLAIVGALDGFNLQEWKKVFTRFSSVQSSSSILHKLRTVNVKLNTLNVFKQQFDNMTIRGKILANKDWSFNVEQKKIAADLTYNQKSNELSGFVRYLHLDKMNKSDNNKPSLSSAANPADIPNLNLRVDNVSVGSVKIGNVILKSKSTPEQWLINYCRIDSPVYQFIVDGEWMQKGKINQTRMQVKLHLNDLAKTLERWEISPAVDAGKGDLEFRGGWKGSIYDFSLASLNGAMYLQLKNGRITHLSPETEEKLGLGKLLSILSLQTIPRRLKLDFSDLSEDGYSFDTFKGNFNINNGTMSTQDSYIDGPVAYASMKGDLDLVRHLYDLNLRISPHITASLPIVATIAGGPIAGLAAWVANKIINQSMQKITAYSYKVSGPWNLPVVQQLSMVKKIVKK